MGTISAMIIICCLIISASLTVVIILVTIPTEINYESHYPKIKLENDKHSYQSFLSSTIIPMKNWKQNQKKSSQRRTTVNLSTNIVIGRDKNVTLNNHESSINQKKFEKIHDKI
ncbi:hypothetical protein WUBG_08489 [Wuchereria bancrofti]|uniref:Nematode cuticle collagen N-terminal domain-containing protein n=1 Tax=Wuchereria bancrofti TaxID=6293 RepID=J9EU06_WUCBA|nr:hypothetical protein WUBG_08489 [Wuchereria bancrofti]